MKKLFPAILVIAIFLLASSVYVVNETEQVVVTQFGKPVGDPIIDAGLKFKIPFIQKIIRFEKRILEWDGAANEIPTNDDKYIFIDTFARWRISDPLTFYKAAKNERNAQSRLDDVIDGIVRDEISIRSMEEIIRSSNRPMETYEDEETVATSEGAREEIVERILQRVSDKLIELDMGIEVLDVQLKRITYNPQVQLKLFQRMISEQEMIAEEYRGKGQGAKQERLGEQIKDERIILSEAYKEAQTIKGEADAYAINTYSDAYEQRKDGKIDPDAVEFYEFLKSLDAYENIFDSSTKLILSTDNEFFKYLK